MAAGKVTIDTSINRKGIQRDYAALQNDTSNFAKNMGQSISKGASTAIKALSGLKKLIAAVLSVALLLNFAMQSVRAARQYSDAMTGLQSILEGQGRSFSDAQKFIESYTQDGLVPATDAITAYKNLASRGYSDDQIKTVMLALKDAAAYGRQASLTMGAAIASASEGLKNENSLLVDNAGVTKNVAKMWEDYARSIGTTAANLTQQQKIQAEVNGILAETRFQTGDAARVAGTFSGQIMQLQFGFNNLKVAVGNAIIPIINAIMPAVNVAVTALTKLFNVFSQVTAAIFGGSAKQMTVLADANSGVASAANNAANAQKAAGGATKQAAKEAKGALASFDELNVLQSKSDSGGSGGGGGGSPAGGGGVAVTPAVNTSEAESGISDFAAKVLAALQPIMIALAGLKVELDRLGRFAWQGLLDFYNSFLKPVGKWVLGEGLPRFIDAITNGLAAIDWAKINDALHGLWVALAPFAINIGEGLLWLWENVLVPFGSWTMNEIVPRFIDILAAAIGSINSIINEFKPLGQWLWDNFLHPLAQWSGGAIVTVLDGIVTSFQWLNTVLSEFGSWASEHQKTIENLAIIFGTLALAITAIAIAMNLQTIATTALAIATGVWNIVAGIGAAVTSVFGAAMAVLTSPITLIILAIAAVIAIVLLLINNWDFVKEKAIEIWSIIKEFFVNLFTSIGDFFTNIWTGIKNFFIGIWNSLLSSIRNIISSIQNVITSIFTAISTFASDTWTGLKDAVISAITNMRDGLSNIVESIKTTFVNTFSSIKSSVVDIFQGIWSAIKNVINSILGGIQGLVNGVTGGVNSVIRTLNNLKFTVPDWIPGLGGKTFGFSIPELSAPQIPRLATGAVIPPNHEFLAILGDQRSGTNIEAPLETILEAMKMALADRGGQDITIRFAGNLAELVRLLKPYIDKENSRVGGSLITKGAY